jgi:integration host factor subunit alpha
MALTKADIANCLFDEIGLTKREAKEIVELFFAKICDALGQGHEVKISGFGNFKLNDKDERPGRNPKTGDMIPVSARRVVTFHSGQKLRARVEVYAGKGTDDAESAAG